MRFAAIYCPAESILVRDRATKVFVALAMSRWRHVAIVEACRLRCCAVLEMKRWKAKGYVTILVKLRVGKAVSVAENSATVLSTAVFTSARKVVIRKIRSPHIARRHPTLCLTVLVGKRR